MEKPIITPDAKETFNPHSVAIFFPTYYRDWKLDQEEQLNADQVRGDASISTVTKAIAAGHRVVIVDGGSSEAYISKLHELGVATVPQQERGIGAAKRQALKIAMALDGAKILLLIQPEKDDVVKYVPELISPIINGEFDLVVAARRRSEFEETYPHFQYQSETWANRWCNRIAHMLNVLPKDGELDWFFGVKVLRNDPELVQLFMKKYKIINAVSARKSLDPERYSDFDVFPTIAALTSGKKVTGVEISFRYPNRQRQIEETLALQFLEKRRMQSQSILAEFVQYARLLTVNSKNRLVQVIE